MFGGLPHFGGVMKAVSMLTYNILVTDIKKGDAEGRIGG